MNNTVKTDTIETFDQRLERERNEQKIADNQAVKGLSENLKGWKVERVVNMDGIPQENRITLTAPNGLEMMFSNANGPRRAYRCRKGKHEISISIWSLHRKDGLTSEINISAKKTWAQIAKDITRRIDISIYKASVDNRKAEEQAHKDYEKQKAEVYEIARKLCYGISGFYVEDAYPKEVYFKVCVPVAKMQELAAWVKANTKQEQE